MHRTYAPTLLKNGFQSSFENLMFGKVLRKQSHVCSMGYKKKIAKPKDKNV
jgi:hypothetical protein